MKSICAAFAIVACFVSGTALACEDLVANDAMAFAQPSASRKPVVVACEGSGCTVPGRPLAAAKKTANRPDTSLATPKGAKKPVELVCAGSDC